jgi:hypothetical protein
MLPVGNQLLRCDMLRHGRRVLLQPNRAVLLHPGLTGLLRIDLPHLAESMFFEPNI